MNDDGNTSLAGRLTLCRAARFQKTLLRAVAPIACLLALDANALLHAQFVEATELNTLEYDHLRLRSGRTAPYVLSVENGDYFQIVFTNTDPTKFSYTISVVREEQVNSASTFVAPEPVPSNADGRAAVTMRHDRDIFRYRVRVARIGAGDSPVPVDPNRRPVPGTPSAPSPPPVTPAPPAPTPTPPAPTPTPPAPIPTPPAPIPTPPAPTPTPPAPAPTPPAATTPDEPEHSLYPVTFDVWVETRGWEVSFTAGLAFSNLTNDQYFLKTNDMGTADVSDDTQTVEMDPDAADDFRPDIMALANVRYPQRWHGLGLAFGLGIGDGSQQRYFFGPSYVFGRNFILTGGWMGGPVDALPVGQLPGQPAINGANTLSAQRTRFKNGFYLGLGFTFAPRRNEFMDALSSSTAVTSAANAAPSISAVGDQKVEAGGTTAPIAFKINDDKTGVSDLSVSATSSNEALVPSAKLVLAGTEADRTIALTANPNVSGTAIVTIKVTDGIHTTERPFKIAVNNQPTIGDIGDLQTTVGADVPVINVSVGDAESAVTSLVVTARSNNQELVPNGNIAIGGTGATRTLTITPRGGQSGSAQITVTVADLDGATTSDTFRLTVSEP